MKFRPHGSAHYSVEGNLFVWRAVGPFDAEFFRKMIRENWDLQQQMKARGPWAMFGIIEECALITPDAVEYLTATLPGRRSTTGCMASAWVIKPEVEWHPFLNQIICNFANDIPRRVFDDELAAHRWVTEILTGAQSGSPQAAG